MLSAVTSIYFLHIRLSCLLNVLPNSAGTCKPKTPRSNEECISHRRNDSIQSGAGRSEINVTLHLEWLTIDAQLLLLVYGAEYSTIGHFYAIFGIIYTPPTWWLCDGLHKQDDDNFKRWRQVNLLTQTVCSVKTDRHLEFIAQTDIPTSVTMSTSCTLIKLL